MKIALCGCGPKYGRGGTLVRDRRRSVGMANRFTSSSAIDALTIIATVNLEGDG